MFKSAQLELRVPRSTWGRNDFCYLEDLYVCPSARGQKVGKKLIEHVQ